MWRAEGVTDRFETDIEVTYGDVSGSDIFLFVIIQRSFQPHHRVHSVCPILLPKSKRGDNPSPLSSIVVQNSAHPQALWDYSLASTTNTF